MVVVSNEIVPGSLGAAQAKREWQAQITVELLNRPPTQLALPLKTLQVRLQDACRSANVKAGDCVRGCVDLVDELDKASVSALAKFHTHLRTLFPWMGEFDVKLVEPVVLAVVVMTGLVKSKYRLDDLIPPS